MAGAGLLLVAAGSAWARAELLDSERFAAAATDTLQRPAVRDLVAAEITERLIADAPGATRAVAEGRRDALDREIATVVATPGFRAAFRPSVASVHRALLSGDDARLRLDLTGTSSLVGSAAAAVDPRLGAAVSAESLREVTLGEEGGLPGLDQIDRGTETLLGVSLLAAAAALGLAFALDARRWRTLTVVGVALAAGAALMGAASTVIPAALSSGIGDRGVRAAAEEVVGELLGPLQMIAVGLGAVGLVAAGLGWMAGRRARPAVVV